MHIFNWIMFGLMAGGLGLASIASKQGWGLQDPAQREKHMSSRVGSTYHGGRYYRGGKH